MRILVTGFEPFGGMSTNPTQELVAGLTGRTLPGVELHTAVLPVEYDTCLAAVLDEVDRLAPDAVIACGLAAGRTAVTPERIAVNVKDASHSLGPSDNAGVRPRDVPVTDGPDGLFSTLPVRAIEQALLAAGIPARISDTAGTYICNNTMYGLLDHLRATRSDTLAGFLHFPASTEMAVADPRLPSLPLAMMDRALLVAIETLATHLFDIRA